MKKLCLLLPLALALTACGYGFRGTVSYLPQEIKTVAIPYLTNQTGEQSLEILVTQALILEFNRSKLLTLTEANQADVVLQGKVTGITSAAVAYEDVRFALKRRVAVTVSMEMLRRHDQKIIWKNAALSEAKDYDVSSDSTATENNRQAAVKDAVRLLAEKIHDAIFENF